MRCALSLDLSLLPAHARAPSLSSQPPVLTHLRPVDRTQADQGEVGPGRHGWTSERESFFCFLGVCVQSALLARSTSPLLLPLFHGHHVPAHRARSLPGSHARSVVFTKPPCPCLPVHSPPPHAQHTHTLPPPPISPLSPLSSSLSSSLLKIKGCNSKKSAFFLSLTFTFKQHVRKSRQSKRKK